MKLANTTLTFLDLIFSLLGVTTILTLILSITVGRTEYRLANDYVLVTVSWRAQAEDASCRCELIAGETPCDWTFRQAPTPKEVIGGTSYESVFYAAPLRAGTWHVNCCTANATAELIQVETKRGPLPPIAPAGSTTDILVDTAGES
ncbi:MAG TPA: hypothetical protein VMF30_10045 [Pirellulales bacterium]|nr:hypothetical protein [Pirellulales bacterium]